MLHVTLLFVWYLLQCSSLTKIITFYICIYNSVYRLTCYFSYTTKTKLPISSGALQIPCEEHQGVNCHQWQGIWHGQMIGTNIMSHLYLYKSRLWMMKNQYTPRSLTRHHGRNVGKHKRMHSYLWFLSWTYGRICFVA